MLICRSSAPGWAGVPSQLVAPPNWPSLGFSDGNGLGSLTGSNGVGSELYWQQAQYTLSGTLTKIAGRHQVKFGGQVRRVSWISDPDNNNVSVNFNQFATASSVRHRGHGGKFHSVSLAGNPRQYRHDAFPWWRLTSLLHSLRFLCRGHLPGHQKADGDGRPALGSAEYLLGSEKQ